MDKSFIIKGNICYSPSAEKLVLKENAYLVCEKGLSSGVFDELPKAYSGLPVEDVGDSMVIPGMCDLHVHAPQYAFRGTAMDLELIDWLNTYTFPQEIKYKDINYAERAYSIFVDDLKKSATTRACIFATIHTPATLLLMDKLEKTGLYTYVGRVNMDRNALPDLMEDSSTAALEATDIWIKMVSERNYKNTRAILTPRFIPSCSNDLMKGLGLLQKNYNLPVQSHLSENPGEVQWVSELRPDSDFYGDAYYKDGLFGGDVPTVMAHCVYSDDREIDLMKSRGVFVAHCPESNINLSSGIAPIRKYMDLGIKIGLGTDVAGGANLSMFKAVTLAIQASKLRWRLVDESQRPLNLEEAFFLATKGGGEFFGKVGSFEPGYELDALIIRDSDIKVPEKSGLKDRLERLIYLSGDGSVIGKYVSGNKIF